MFSRKMESKLRPVDLNQVLEQTAKMLSRTIPKMIATELTLAEELRTIYADPALVQQVVMNLALNARDAMPEGGNLVIQTRNAILDGEYCKAHIEAMPGDYALLSVSDTGCGMTRETLEHIFDPFYTTKGPGKGTGLGLSIVYGIVKSHRGHIQCYSQPGKGTTFRIYLPIASREQEQEDTGNTRPLRGGNETILLVEDEDAIRDLGKTLLEMFGYTVLTAASGIECLEIYAKEEEHVALVVLDLIMPRMSGKDCLLRIIKRNPAAKVIICSGYASEWQIEESVRGQAKAWLTKPYQTHEMLEIVRRVLDEE
jgi:CheY-like chemotaxis protein